jgi:hypothetical protein
VTVSAVKLTHSIRVWFKWKLGDVVVTTRALPITLKHFFLEITSTSKTFSATALSVTISATELIYSIWIRLEREFSDRIVASRATPITLKHFSLEPTSAASSVVVCHFASIIYFLTFLGLEQNGTTENFGSLLVSNLRGKHYREFSGPVNIG